MAHEFLDGLEAGAAHGEIGGEGVAEIMEAITLVTCGSYGHLELLPHVGEA